MRPQLLPLVVSVVLFPSVLQAAQQPAAASPPVTRDPQAVAVLQRAIAAMGRTVPSDSTATGTVTTVAGSLTETGTVIILTRGTDQTAEQIQTSSSSLSITYSKGQAARTIAATPSQLSVDFAVTAQSASFPLALLAGALSNTDVSVSYIGVEASGSAAVHHVQIWDTFASVPDLQPLAPSTLRDVWIDSATLLPTKVSFTRREAGGAAPTTLIEVAFADFRQVNGVLYPFSIQTSLNGTLWASIQIQSVAFNTGLIDANFAVN
jgi:hypothetical protein